MVLFWARQAAGQRPDRDGIGRIQPIDVGANGSSRRLETESDNAATIGAETEPMEDFPEGFVIGTESNVMPGDLNEENLAIAAAATELRIAKGYDACGTLGGPYSESSPPAGKTFGGYHKGATRIVWQSAGSGRDEASPSSSLSRVPDD